MIAIEKKIGICARSQQFVRAGVAIATLAGVATTANAQVTELDALF